MRSFPLVFGIYAGFEDGSFVGYFRKGLNKSTGLYNDLQFSDREPGAATPDANIPLRYYYSVGRGAAGVISSALSNLNLSSGIGFPYQTLPSDMKAVNARAPFRICHRGSQYRQEI